MVPVRFYVLGTVTALAVGIIYVYRRLIYHKKPEPSEIKAGIFEEQDQKHTPPNPKQVIEEPTILAPNQVSPAEIEHLVSLLASSNTNKFTGILKKLIHFSNDNVNMPSFRRQKTLDVLSSHILLGCDGGFLKTVNVLVLNLFTNLMVDDIVREYIMTKVDRFFDIQLSNLAEEELVAVLRLLANLALLEDGCRCVRPHVTDIYEILGNDSNQVERQLWTFLLNLSCDTPSVSYLLRANAFAKAGETIVKLIKTTENEVILEKVLNFLCNVYSNLLIQPLNNYSIDSMGEQLLNVKSSIKESVVLVELTTADSDTTLYAVAKRLTDLLDQ